MARGSVTKRGDAWRVTVELPPDPATGKRRQRSESVRGTKRHAQARLTELQALADKQLLCVSPKMTVAEYLERWLGDHAATRTPSTYEFYSSAVRLYVVPCVGAVPLDKLAPVDVVKLVTTVRAMPRGDGKPGKLSASTVASSYRTLRAALNNAVRWQLIARSPCDGVQPPRIPREEMRTFSPEQARLFLTAADTEGAKWHAFFAFLLNTGCRPGEARALQWEDIDFDASTVRIQRTARRIAKQGVLTGTTKSSAGRRPIPLSADLVELLCRHRVEQDTQKHQLESIWQDNGLVFPSDLGTHLEDHATRVVFERICRAAGVPRIRLYDLRHTSASLLLASGVHVKAISERLGHSSVALTLSVYSHTLPSLQKEASETLAGILRGTA